MIKASFLSLFLTCVAFPVLAGDKVVNFEDDDPAMNAAMAEARATLDEILTMIPMQGEHYHIGFTVKAGLAPRDTKYGTENIWVGEVTPLPNNRFRGALQNDPNRLEGKTIGSLVTFEKDQIVDWSVVSGGKLYGNYTTRVMLPLLATDQAEYLRSILSENPMP